MTVTNHWWLQVIGDSTAGSSHTRISNFAKTFKTIPEGSWEFRPGPGVAGWDPYKVLPTLTDKAEAWLAQEGQLDEADLTKAKTDYLDIGNKVEQIDSLLGEPRTPYRAGFRY